MAESNMLGTSLAASTQSRNSRSWVGTKMFKPLCMNSSTSKYPMRFFAERLDLGRGYGSEDGSFTSIYC